MIEIIISAIFLISPGDSTSIPFDITILFDPPILTGSAEVYLDGMSLAGEKKSDYFFSETNNLSSGKHIIKVENGTEKEEWSFFVTEDKKEFPLSVSGNFSIGDQNTYSSDTFNTEKNEALLGMDFSVYKNDLSLRFSLYHDPAYQIDWYPYISYLKGTTYLEAGYVYPYLDELTICSPGGLGLTGEINLKYFSLTPVILYSENYDSLFADYPRILWGGKVNITKGFLDMGLTAFYGKDDTSSVILFTFDDPKESAVLSGEAELNLNAILSIKIKGAFSRGNPNLYSDSIMEGSAAEGKLILESGLNSLEAGVRKIGEGYLTMGNSYLYDGRISGFTNGLYEKGIFSTYFDFLVYKEDTNPGTLLNQSFKLKISDLFSPILEYQYAKYPEYYNEKYWYVGAGFESFLDFLQLENTIGIEKTFYLEEKRSFRVLSNISWYHDNRIISAGVYTYITNENTSFDFNLDGTIGLGSFGNININYYPYLENGYKEHLLRIIFEYDF